MPKVATGTVEKRADGQYWARIRFANGKRPWVPLGRGLSEAQAKAKSKSMAQRCKNLDYVPPVRRIVTRPGQSAETFKEWAARWVADRRRRKLLTVDDDASRLANHVEPILGALPVAAINRDDVEKVRDALDEKILTGELAWTTARNVWTVVTKAFSDAKGSKNRALRVRDDNPAIDVEPPERGTKRTKQYIYPSEFLKLVACERISLRWRRIYALAIYTYMRAGELEVLEWRDVDLEHGLVHVNKALQEDDTIGPPKNGESRRFPIEPALKPLLVAMRLEAEALAAEKRERVDGYLVTPVPQKKDRAAVFRRHLLAAGVERWDLHAKRDHARLPITFHDLRATGLTWAAVRGDDLRKMKQRAGHKSYSTTEIYTREAESHAADFGVVFPELPSSIL